MHVRSSSLVSATQALQIVSPESAERPGLDAALIASFPSYAYKVPAASDVESGSVIGCCTDHIST